MALERRHGLLEGRKRAEVRGEVHAGEDSWIAVERLVQRDARELVPLRREQRDAEVARKRGLVGLDDEQPAPGLGGLEVAALLHPRLGPHPKLGEAHLREPVVERLAQRLGRGRAESGAEFATTGPAVPDSSVNST